MVDERPRARGKQKACDHERFRERETTKAGPHVRRTRLHVHEPEAYTTRSRDADAVAGEHRAMQHRAPHRRQPL